MDILRRTINIRKTLYKATGIGLITGIIVTFSISKQYTVGVTLSPEMGNSKGTNGIVELAASFLESDATIGDDTDTLNASLSSDVVSSTPSLLELMDVNVPTDKGDMLTLETYLDSQSSPQWSYIIGMSRLMINGVKFLFTNKNDNSNETSRGTIELIGKESEKIDALRRRIIASVGKKTAITSIPVTLQGPKVTAVVADSVVHKLQEYIMGYRTSKSKDDCVYLEKLFKERRDEYYDTQKKYADYVDIHGSLILQSIRTEQGRLQNDMSLAYQVYGQVANQLWIARAKVQEERPVLVVVEPVVVPWYPSGMGKKPYLIIFLFLSVVATARWLLFDKDYLDKIRKGLV